MRRDEVVAVLRKFQAERRQLLRLRERVRRVEDALEGLDGEDRELIESLVLDNRPGQVERLCGALDVEPATVYRRRNRALKRLGERL